jgi:hypothetical protein
MIDLVTECLRPNRRTPNDVEVPGRYNPTGTFFFVLYNSGPLKHMLAFALLYVFSMLIYHKHS